MRLCVRVGASAILACCLALSYAQTLPQLTPEQIIENAYGSVALVVTTHSPGERVMLGAGVVVRQSGVLLTANHLVKGADAVQVRFKNGEVFDSVQLLGVDTRRDVAAIKITAERLPVLPVANANDANAGDPMVVVSHAAALPWSASTGVISAYRLSDEVPGAGSGYRLLQFTAPVAPGSSGGLVIDGRGRALAIVIGSIRGQNLNFGVPIDSVLGLADMPASKAFASGSDIRVPTAATMPVAPRVATAKPANMATPEAADKSDALNGAKDRDYILGSFKTILVDAREAQYFNNDQLKAALARNKGFAGLNVRVVDDPKIADTVLHVGYTFAWEYPFELKHQNTTMILLAGKGLGPFSGPLGAANVAKEFVKLLKPYRTTPVKHKKHR